MTLESIIFKLEPQAYFANCFEVLSTQIFHRPSNSRHMKLNPSFPFQKLALDPPSQKAGTDPVLFLYLGPRPSSFFIKVTTVSF